MSKSEHRSSSHRPSANRLADQKSPYLLQHAHNPVDWYPWGAEAFEKATRENKPIFLSIGYSTCHWCHVMAHESFESDRVAEVMNREFVNIKVDREERPDVDRIYMTFVQATTGHGGWPMSVWLTPDLQPFVGGTYFPPEDRYGHPGFVKVLERVAAAWKQNRDKIVEQGANIVEALRQSQTRSRGASAPGLDERILHQAFEQFSSTFDAEQGGFGSAPKFPRPVALNFLSRFYNRQRLTDKAAAERSLEMFLHTLRKMAAGGMHDHLGGGFHRYSVDRLWHVPHFEKMLYDQAQLATAYLDAFQITRAGEFAAIARDTLDYVLRDMTSPDGGFFSAEDADSEVALVEPRAGEGGRPGNNVHSERKAEGAFYVWDKAEVDRALGQAADIFNLYYGIEPGGNVSSGSDPHGELRGKNVLIQRHTITETAAKFGRTEDEVQQILAESRATLFAIRAKRPRPHLDDKILAAWNGLMISAFARAAQVLDQPKYLRAAIAAAKFVRERLYDSGKKLLFRSYREGRGNVEGFAEDYAFVTQGLLDLYEASVETAWLKSALQLQHIQDELFWDSDSGGYFTTSGRDESVVLRMKDDNDSAEPSANSVAALNLLRLAQIHNEPELRRRADQTISAFAPTLTHYASAMPQLLVAFDFGSRTPQQIVIAGEADSPETKALLKEVRRHFLPNNILLLADAEGRVYLGEKNESIRAMSEVNRKPAAYVCEDFTCRAPVTDSTALAELLGDRI